MWCSKGKRLRSVAASIGLVVIAALGAAASPAVAAGGDLGTEADQFLAAFVARNPTLRLATRADCRCERALAAARRKTAGYDPDVVIGDFNGDGQPDLAALFYNRDWYEGAPGVLIVFSRVGAGNPRLVFSRDDLPLDGRGLSLSAKAPHRLGFGRIGAAGCTYFPKGSGYREDCAAHD